MHISKTTRFIVSAKKNFIAGIFVTAPIAAIIWILAQLWGTLSNLVSIIPNVLHPKNLFHIKNYYAIWFIDVSISIVMLMMLLALIWWMGVFSRAYLGQQVLSLIRHAVARVPVLRTVYSTLEQLLETFSGNKTKNFRRVVRMEFPRKGVYTLALVTGEQNGYLTVYVPTTPNPTGGYYLYVDQKETLALDMTVEEALKEIISMGLVKKHD